MFDYTKSAVNNTVDFVKRLIYAIQIIIQLVYIAFVSYRLFTKSGNLIGNIALVVISIFYIMFQIITTREFYAKKQFSRKIVVRRVVKTAKYTVNFFIILIEILSLINGTSKNESTTILVVALMLFGILVSVTFDITILLIDMQVENIKSAFLHDVKEFRDNHSTKTNLLKIAGLDLEKMFPSLDDEKAINKVKKINHKQKLKAMRKRDFKKSTDE